MNNHIREQLSAMADGEIEAQGARFLIKRLDHDAEFRGLWERYHLIRDCLRRQNSSMAPADFCDCVSARIDKEFTAPSPNIHRVHRNLRTFAAGAIAASVAAIALFVVRGGPADIEYNLADARVPHVADMTTQDLAPPYAMTSVGAQERFIIIQKPVASELDTYFMRHGEAAGGIGSLGIVPSVRAVAASSAGTVQKD